MMNDECVNHVSFIQNYVSMGTLKVFILWCENSFTVKITENEQGQRQ